MKEVLEEENFGPQYPAEFYTSRPNDTALLSPLYDCTFKGIFTQETEESNLALKSFISAVFEREIKKVTLKSNEPHKETRKQKSMLFDMSIEFDDGTTGVDEIPLVGYNEGRVKVYSISGQKVIDTRMADFEACWQQLPSGIYIVNGKKKAKIVGEK